MAAQNDFLTFATGGGANVVTQNEYSSLGLGSSGFQSGIAPSAQLNKVWRQSSIMAAMIGQFIVDNTTNPAIDDGSTANLELSFKAAIQAVTRIKATGNTTFYVNTAFGLDTNTGLTSLVPFKTINACINAIYHGWDFNGYTCTISIANGTYNEGNALTGLPLGCSAVNFVGNVDAPSYVIINATNSNCFYVAGGFIGSISGVTLVASGVTNGPSSNGWGVRAFNALVTLNIVAFGTCQNGQVCASTGGIVAAAIGTSLSFTGTSPFAMYAQAGGSIWFAGITIVFFAGTTYSVATAGITAGASLYINGTTFINPTYVTLTPRTDTSLTLTPLLGR